MLVKGIMDILTSYRIELQLYQFNSTPQVEQVSQRFYSHLFLSEAYKMQKYQTTLLQTGNSSLMTLPFYLCLFMLFSILHSTLRNTALLSP